MTQKFSSVLWWYQNNFIFQYKFLVTVFLVTTSLPPFPSHTLILCFDITALYLCTFILLPYTYFIWVLLNSLLKSTYTSSTKMMVVLGMVYFSNAISILLYYTIQAHTYVFKAFSQNCLIFTVFSFFLSFSLEFSCTFLSAILYR